MGKLIPLVIALAGLGAGVGAGIAMRPEVALSEDGIGQDLPSGAPQGETASPCGDAAYPSEPVAPLSDQDSASEFVRLDNQFVFPLVHDGAVSALVVLSLTLEVAPAQSDAVKIREPKLRDGFLRVLLDHANAGGFRGAFTSNESLGRLRSALLEKGRQILGDALYDVLILDINRQDA